jgi:hypothetical protein
MGSNARWCGNVFASNSRICRINLWSNPGGSPGGDDRSWNWLVHKITVIELRWLDTVFKNSGVQHFEMFKLRIFRIYSADIVFFYIFWYLYFQITLVLVIDSSLLRRHTLLWAYDDILQNGLSSRVVGKEAWWPPILVFLHYFTWTKS